MASSSSGRVGGVAMTFPVRDSSCSVTSPTRLPRRLRRRLSEARSPVTVEDIEAKLKDADLRRQQFYGFLSSKARQRQRSPSSSTPSQGTDLGQRIEAKLNAAEQKRLSILSESQMRLARLDQLRQAAKNGVEMQVEKKRGELGMKVLSRVQQAEANRMLIMKCRRQGRAARKERTAQSLMRRRMQESRYKERVRNQLEDRLQRARKQRAELLRQRKSSNGSPGADAKLNEQAENLARKLIRCWRKFVKSRGTTYSVTKAFNVLNINEGSVKSIPFEQFARQMESDSTLKAVKSLVDRLEVLVMIRQGTNSYALENIDHLLKHVATEKRRRTGNHAGRVRGQKRSLSGGDRVQSCRKLSRYPVRIFMCAYMLVGHPDAVLSGKGPHEIALAEAAVKFVKDFELLIKIILEGCGLKSFSTANCVTFRSQLEAFDKAWCSYLHRFVEWKNKDAKLLEEDLVKIACQLELSMMHTCKLTPEGGDQGLTHDMKTVQKQVMDDQILLKEKVKNLSGAAGIERMESAISDVRIRYFTSKDCGSPFGTPVAHITSSEYHGASASSPVSDVAIMAADSSSSRSVARSLFKEDDATAGPEVTVTPAVVKDSDDLSDNITPLTENELLVNEIVHEHRRGIADNLDISDEDDNSFKAKIKEAVEKAFWDGIMESMNQEHTDYSWILKLMTEIRDELCEISPSWREEITGIIDIEILAQILRSGTLDMDFFGKMLEYALVTLRKLSAPAHDDEMKATHRDLLNELRGISQSGDISDSSNAVAVIKGIRFVLQQIQILKKEISKAKIRLLEPLVKGPKGLEYLRKAFMNRYGPPSNAYLPLTKSWLSLVKTDVELVWKGYEDSLSALSGYQEAGIPPVTLRTGTSRLPSLQPVAKGNEQPECKGETIDLLMRVGLLKLVSNIEGLTEEVLPETLKLNVSRLRSMQSLMQKTIVMSTSMLVLRRILASEHLIASASDMDNIISESTKQLSKLLDAVEDVGMEEIVGAMFDFSDDIKHVVDVEKVRGKMGAVANMLSKSLQSGDAVFSHVSQIVNLAARAAVLGGTGKKGKEMVEKTLGRVGAASLTDKFMEIGEVLIVVALTSASVHGPWYEQLFKDM